MITEAGASSDDRAATRPDGDWLKSEYLDDVFAYAARRLAGREDAEDATAEAFQAALTHLHRLKTQDPRLWLFGIARRKVADAIRRSRRRREVPLHENLVSSPEDSQDDKETQALVRNLILNLPPDQKETLMLHYLEGLSHKQIAVVLGKSPAAVNSLLQRARARVLREGKHRFELLEETR